MKSIPRKYLFLFFTLVIVEVIVIIAFILDALFDTSVWAAAQGEAKKREPNTKKQVLRNRVIASSCPLEIRGCA